MPCFDEPKFKVYYKLIYEYIKNFVHIILKFGFGIKSVYTV